MENKMTVELHREDDFQPMVTTADLVVNYPETKELCGHIFHHVTCGIYAVDEPFEIMEDELEKEMNRLGMIAGFKVDSERLEEGRRLKVYFGFDSDGADHYIFHSISNNMDERFLLYPEMKDPETGELTRDSVREFSYKLDEIYLGKGEMGFFAQEGDFGDIYHPKKMIRFAGEIGVEIEENIWYFPATYWHEELGFFSGYPWISLDYTTKGIPAAILGNGDSLGISISGKVHYLAVGEPAIRRMREMYEKDRIDVDFFHRLPCDRTDETEAEKTGDARQAIEKSEKSSGQGQSVGDEDAFHLPEDAVELVEGIGFSGLEVCFSTPFRKGKKLQKYEWAYIRDGFLYLVMKDRDDKRSIDSLRLETLSELLVRVEKEIVPGVEIPHIYYVIDCEEKKLKEILTPEAYEMYCEKEVELC